MEESQFVAIFKQASDNILWDSPIIVERGRNLLYQLPLNRQLKPSVADTISPKRGDSAFETDICISEKVAGPEELLFPRVVIEFKPKITSHDILTYSAKAGKHRSMYPWLRYGLLASDIDAIPNRFFIHNEHLDFFIAAHSHRSNLEKFIKKLIEKELRVSKALETIRFGNNNFDYYRTEIIFGRFDETQ